MSAVSPKTSPTAFGAEMGQNMCSRMKCIKLSVDTSMPLLKGGGVEDISTEATLQGGFLPIFWDVPKSTMHAVSDIGTLAE